MARNSFFFSSFVNFFSFCSIVLLEVLSPCFHHNQIPAGHQLHAAVGWKKVLEQDDWGMKPQVLRTLNKTVAIPWKPQRSIIYHLRAAHNQSHALAAKTGRWPPRGRGLDFKCERKGARTKARSVFWCRSAWDRSIRNSGLILSQEQWMAMFRKSQDWQIVLSRTWRTSPWQVASINAPPPPKKTKNKKDFHIAKPTWERLTPAERAPNGASASYLRMTDVSVAQHLLLLFICLCIPIIMCIIIYTLVMPDSFIRTSDFCCLSDWNSAEVKCFTGY